MLGQRASGSHGTWDRVWGGVGGCGGVWGGVGGCGGVQSPGFLFMGPPQKIHSIQLAVAKNKSAGIHPPGSPRPSHFPATCASNYGLVGKVAGKKWPLGVPGVVGWFCSKSFRFSLPASRRTETWDCPIAWLPAREPPPKKKRTG